MLQGIIGIRDHALFFQYVFDHPVGVGLGQRVYKPDRAWDVISGQFVGEKRRNSAASGRRPLTGTAFIS